MQVSKITPLFQGKIHKKSAPHKSTIHQVQTYSTKLSGIIDGLWVEYEKFSDSRKDKSAEKFTLNTLTLGAVARLEYDLANAILTETIWNEFYPEANKKTTMQLNEDEIKNIKEGIELFKMGKLDKERISIMPKAKDAFGLQLESNLSSLEYLNNIQAQKLMQNKN